MKKASIITLCILSLFVNILPVSASEQSLLTEEEIYQEYENDPQFNMMLNAYGEQYANDFLSSVLQTRREEMLRGGGGNVCYEYVTNIKQTSGYNCGTTTVLQTLYGLDCESNVSGSTNAAKISTLDAEYNVDSQGHLMVYQAVDALNKYSDYTYIYELGSSMTLNSFEEKIAVSLTSCRPVILHARTEYIGYYGGHESGHYISLDYVNRTTDKVRLVDCNNNDAYFGIHDNVDLSDAYKAIHDASGRYVIR